MRSESKSTTGLLAGEAGAAAILVTLGVGLWVFLFHSPTLLPDGLALAFPITLLLAVATALLTDLCIQAPLLWRPPYITTDPAGFTISDGRQSRSVVWSDVVYVERAINQRKVMIRLRGERTLWISLLGHPPEFREGFAALV